MRNLGKKKKDLDLSDERRIVIEVSTNASELILNASSIGLHDINYWTTTEIMQWYFDSEQRIAFSAFISENGILSEKPSGIIVGEIEEEGRLWIELLAVDESQRRSGIATALIEKLAQYGLGKQLRAIFVDLDDDNLEAEDFYKSIGFKKAGKIIEYYYDYSDATILIKRL